jgi:uncharacterized BrkB/YihY/UPF0761 family membrane protein
MLPASILATISWKLLKNVKGYGGKLGFIAFLSVLLVMLPDIYKAEVKIIETKLELDLLVGILVVCISILSIKLTWVFRDLLRNNFSESESVLGSALVGLLFGLLSICIFLCRDVWRTVKKIRNKHRSYCRRNIFSRNTSL